MCATCLRSVSQEARQMVHGSTIMHGVELWFAADFLELFLNRRPPLATQSGFASHPRCIHGQTKNVQRFPMLNHHCTKLEAKFIHFWLVSQT